MSTEDAYVNGHATFVAPRVSGQVMKVLVDDNQRVKKGDLLVQLDKEPYQVQVALKRTAVRAAEVNLAAAESKARGLEAQLGAQRWKLQNASEQVDAQVALLRSQVAALRSQEATLDRARADFKRAEALLPKGAISREEYDLHEQQLRVAAASLAQAQEAIAQTRVSLGLAPQPEKGKELTDVPPDLNQTFSAVRMALADCMQTMTQLGLPLGSIDLTPNKALEEFRRLDKEGNFEQIAKDLVPKVPFVLQAKVALEEARHDLELAELNLRYCDVVERDRRRGGRPEREPRQQRPGGASPDGRPLAHGDLDRREFQGDATGRPADRPAGAVRGGHVRQPPGVRGPDHRVHHGDRSNALPAAGAERHRQLRQDRPAAAGPGRADRLRPGQGTPVRRTVGDALRVLQGTAHGAARGGGPATVGGPSDESHGPPTMTRKNRPLPDRERAKEDSIMSSMALSPTAVNGRSAVNPWIIAGIVVVPTFMEILDTTVANVALRYIAGGLSAAQSDAEWVITSYLAANAIVLPITGWLSAHLGRRNYFLLSIAVFTLASAMCGFATSLPQMILFRVIQGLSGGGLQPCSQGILMDSFPPEKQGTAMTLFGLAAIIAPVVGPTLGGWLCVDYNWRWIFLINVPMGLVALVGAYAVVDDPDYLKQERAEFRGKPLNFDSIGLSLLVLVMCCWEIMLSKGREWDWLGDPFGRVQTL